MYAPPDLCILLVATASMATASPSTPPPSSSPTATASWARSVRVGRRTVSAHASLVPSPEPFPSPTQSVRATASRITAHSPVYSFPVPNFFFFLSVHFFASRRQVALFSRARRRSRTATRGPQRLAGSATILLPTIPRSASMGRGGPDPSQPSIRLHYLNVSPPTRLTTGRVGGDNPPTTDQ
ncbi:hypothetical protein TW95_gp1111 [Pandoravirus inopinatum]|uniref:Uncharacterized protein n=1 Tax=Pandoravirus inopinatum TaxID=1605721 RepID=A0A0B5J7I1_9VIRU|nr:hypothetical protein TW95_gp1111 [Pandoravirus inopinatum]AJF97845.1 hypothetical protein [Pandoravirus inopinatum]